MKKGLVIFILLFYKLSLGVDYYSNNNDSVQYSDPKVVSFLKGFMTPFELCLLNSSDIHEGHTHCNIEAKESIYYHDIHHQKRGHSLYSSCEIGASAGYVAGKDSFTTHNYSYDSNQKCLVKSLSQRKSLMQQWDITVEPHIKVYNLLEDLIKLNISKILFLGDSVNMQMAKFFGCDISRLNNVQLLHQHYLLNHTHINDQSASFSYRGHTINILSVRPAVSSCIYSSKTTSTPICNSTVEKFKSVYDTTIRSTKVQISKYSNSSSRLAIIYNIGLHIQRYNAEWSLQATAKALLELAKESKGQYYIIFRETSAQHFNQFEGGDHDETDRSPYFIPSKSFCCGYSRNESAIQMKNWRNKMFYKYLDELDPQWKTYLGWIPFFNMSLEMYDLHPESNLHQHADCTHYVYLPFRMLSFWTSIGSVLEHLINN
eukprot:gene2100-4105_t